MHSNGTSIISQQVANLDIHGDSAPNGPKGPPPQSMAFETEEPPAPVLHSKGVVSMDITAQFKEAAQHLELGQLIKDPGFTLFESVAALEIMDRKMDSGFLEPGETMEDDYDLTQALLPEEVIGIIDQLLCHEMAWHMGYPLSQTIFTSLYIDRLLSPSPLNLDQAHFYDPNDKLSEMPLTLRILRAYCLGLVKTCYFVNNRVKSEHYYEEEDFVTHTYNRSLLDSIEHDVILQLLQETVKSLDESQNLSADLKSALRWRLRFRAQFLKTVEMADSRTSKELNSLWTDLLAFLPEIKSTIPLGKPLPESFSVKVQRRLASSAPPRPIVQVSQEAAFNHLDQLCRDGSVVVEVLDYFDSQSLLTFVSLFQSRKPQPSVYIRTLLQHYIFGDMIVLGTMSVRQVLDEDLSSIVLPASILLDRDNDEIELPTDPRFVMAARMEMFRSRAAASYLDILRAICQNRCRIRRTLTHTLVDWDNLQIDAEALDQELQALTGETPVIDETISNDPIYSFPLSSWAYFYKLRQMEWIIQMGFELEIYQPDELATMYWYLQYVAKTRSRHLERIRGFVVRSASDPRPAPRGKASTTAAAQTKAEYARAMTFINFSSLEAAAIYGLADAMTCLYTVLQRLSLLPTVPRPYSSDAMRYEVRMKPFLTISLPELIPHDDLRELVTQPKESSLDLLDFAASSAAGAKKAFEILSKLSAEDAFCQGSAESWVRNVKDCLKACIFTAITISTVRKALEAAGKGTEKGKDGKVKIKVEIPLAGKGYHDWWVVPKVVPSV